MSRMIVDASTLPQASSFHGWAADADLHDRQVDLMSALEARDATYAELEDAICTAFILATTRRRALALGLLSADDVAAARAATERLKVAREAHRAACERLRQRWARSIGGDIAPDPRVLERRLKAIDIAQRMRAPWAIASNTASPSSKPTSTGQTPGSVHGEESASASSPALVRRVRSS